MIKVSAAGKPMVGKAHHQTRSAYDVVSVARTGSAAVVVNYLRQAIGDEVVERVGVRG
jgi:hypothetical protein